MKWAWVWRLILLLTTLLPITPVYADTDSFSEKLAKMEDQADGRIGVYAIDTQLNQKLQYRAEERFPFCSTGKIMVVSAILKASENNPSLLQQKIIYTPEDLQQSGYAPITVKWVNKGMSVAELGQAAMEYSDNAALNLLMKILGGPTAVNTYARSIGDATFQIDRWEPELNWITSGELRDTTTPQAMGNSLQKLTLRDTLQPSQRQLLLNWLKNNTTGNLKIRAGVPKSWIVGDKTGHKIGNENYYPIDNDIGVIWPPHCDPIVMIIYFTGNKPDTTEHPDLIASATRLIIAEFAKQDSCIKGAIQ